ncbi:MAG: hypothetical protein M1G31_14040 [Pseudanabaena sp. Salubria-1]|nr:hypothetical protein [Pseudanabaena sp. Salubria-1]
MKKDELELDDDLRPEYDLKSLRVRKLGSGRKSFGCSTVRLEPDVAAIFPSADAVNEALRFLIRVTQQNQPTKVPTLSNTQENNL